MLVSCTGHTGTGDKALVNQETSRFGLKIRVPECGARMSCLSPPYPITSDLQDLRHHRRLRLHPHLQLHPHLPVSVRSLSNSVAARDGLGRCAASQATNVSSKAPVGLVASVTSRRDREGDAALQCRLDSDSDSKRPRSIQYR